MNPKAAAPTQLWSVRLAYRNARGHTTEVGLQQPQDPTRKADYFLRLKLRIPKLNTDLIFGSEHALDTSVIGLCVYGKPYLHTSPKDQQPEPSEWRWRQALSYDAHHVILPSIIPKGADYQEPYAAQATATLRFNRDGTQAIALDGAHIIGAWNGVLVRGSLSIAYALGTEPWQLGDDSLHLGLGVSFRR